MRRGEGITNSGLIHPLSERSKTGKLEGFYTTPQMIHGQFSFIFDDVFSSTNPTAVPVSRSTQYRQVYKEVDPECYEQEGIFIKIRPEEDRREAVIDTAIYPFSSHGRLVMIFNGRAVYGSGTLINSRFVLTAAHNLYPRYFNKEPDSILFIPALNGTECPYGIIGVNRYFYPEEFKNTRLEDYAVLELEEDVGESTGYIQMRMHRPEEIDGIECSLYGYPGYANREENNHQYGMNGIVALIPRENLIIYDIDTEPGMSGSGVYYKSQVENKYFTIGVHIKGYMNQSYNAGTFLTNRRIENIEGWIASYSKPTKHNLQMLTSEVYGRDSEINTIRSFMRQNMRLGVIGLCGVAGVGKSTIALKYATKCKGSYDYIWWINSETRETFRGDVLSLAKELKLEGKNYQEILNKLIPMLNSRAINFLLILDNLQDEDIAKELIATKGHYIITTRLKNIDNEKIDISTLSREASIQLLISRLPNRSQADLDYLANFLEDLPIALLQAAAYIHELQTDVGDYIGHFSGIVTIDDKIKNIVSQNIDFLSEESLHILKIVCLGFCDNIPYDMLYTVFCYSYPGTQEFDFNYHLGNIVKFSILNYDTKKDLLKIHRVLHEASIAKLSGSIDDKVIDYFAKYLYINYMEKQDSFLPEEVNQQKHLTLHAAIFLPKYKNRRCSSTDILLYSKIALSYLDYLLDYETSNQYILIIEQLLHEQIYQDLNIGNTYNNIGLLYCNMCELKKANEYFIKSIRINESILPHNHPIIARSYNNLGFLYCISGEYSKALEYFNKFMKITEEVLTNNHPDIATSYSNLGVLYSKIGNYKKAEEYCIKSLRIREAVFPNNHPDLATSYNSLGLLYYYIGEYNKAEEYQIKTLNIREKVFPNNHPDLASIYNDLGLLYKSMGEYRNAEEYFIKSLAIHEAVLPHNNPDLAVSYNNLGLICYYMGEYSKAEEYYIKGMRIDEAIFPNSHLHQSINYNNLGLLYKSIGSYDQAEKYYIKALNIREAVLPNNHPDLSATYNDLGDLYQSMGEYTKAENNHIKALRIREVVLPNDHPDLANSYNSLGILYYCIGNYEAAQEYYIKSIRIKEAVLPNNHPDLAASFNNLGILYSDIGDYEKSVEYFMKSLSIQEAVLPHNHPDLAGIYWNLGSLYKSIGSYEEAEQYYIKSIKIREEVLPNNHPDLDSSYKHLVLLYFNIGNDQKLVEYLIKSLRIQEAVLPHNHPDLAVSYNRLGMLYFSMENYEAAQEYYIKSLSIVETILSYDNPNIASLYFNIGSFYQSMCIYAEAEKCYLKSLAIRETLLPSNHPDLVIIYNRLRELYLIIGDYEKAQEYWTRSKY